MLNEENNITEGFGFGKEMTIAKALDGDKFHFKFGKEMKTKMKRAHLCINWGYKDNVHFAFGEEVAIEKPSQLH